MSEGEECEDGESQWTTAIEGNMGEPGTEVVKLEGEEGKESGVVWTRKENEERGQGREQEKIPREPSSRIGRPAYRSLKSKIFSSTASGLCQRVSQ